MDRLRDWLPRLGALLATLFLLAFGLRSVWSERPSGRIQLVVWGLPSGEETKGLDAQIREFERRFPHIRIVNLNVGNGSLGSQKLLTAIAGNAPPDLVRQDRFTIGDWAAREAFRPLDDLLRSPKHNGPHDPWRIVPEEYYEACWAEAVYRGRVYAIPMDTDNRLLYWNKKLFREAGLDPEHPPRTWEEAREFNRRLTKRRPNGTFERIGFIPITKQYTNSYFYLYSWQNGGEFMSPDGRTCTMNNPASVEALQWLTDYYTELSGAENVLAFASTFQPREQDPFIIGKMALKIDLNTAIRNLGRFAKDLDYGVAPPPVPAARLRGEGRFRDQPPYITWSGGFSWAIPAGSRHVEEAWLFIKWMNSLESRRIFNRVQKEWNEAQNPPRPYAPDMHANRRINEILFREFAPEGNSPVAVRMREGMRVGLEMMPYARFRPVTFVGQRLWDEHIRAFERATLRQTTPAQALEDARRAVQAELDSVFERERLPLLNGRVAVGGAVAGALLLFGLFFLHCQREGRVAPLLRSEARAGVLFALPWILGFLWLFLGPMLASVVFSLCDYDVLHPPRWAGWRNYAELARDPMLPKAFGNILFLAGIALPCALALSLGIALLLNTRIRGVPLYRAAFYLPSLTPIVAVAIVWLFILNPDSGVINQAWRATLTAWFGIPAPAWLSSEQWSKPALILVALWGVGNTVILWLAGLQGIPQHLYEAADLDGAGAWHRFRHVTLPMLTPYLLFNLIMGTIAWLQRFTDVYILTDGSGGPVDSTMVPIMYLFTNAFLYFKMGYASAWAWVIFAAVLLLTLLNLWASRRWVHYEGERR